MQPIIGFRGRNTVKDEGRMSEERYSDGLSEDKNINHIHVSRFKKKENEQFRSANIKNRLFLIADLSKIVFENPERYIKPQVERPK